MSIMTESEEKMNERGDISWLNQNLYNYLWNRCLCQGSRRDRTITSDLDTVPQLFVSGSPFLFPPVQSMLSAMSSLN